MMLHFHPTSPGRPGLWCVRRARFRDGTYSQYAVIYYLWDRDGMWQGAYETWEEAMADSRTREEA